jgi:hypothetical protein
MRSVRLAAAGVIVLSLFSPLQAADDPRDSPNPYGVLAFLTWNHDWNDHQYDSHEKVERGARLINEAGAGFVRMDFSWNDLEPEAGAFDFVHQDAIVNILEKHDLRLLGVLVYNARWENPQWNSAPDREKYVRYARAVVRHYKDRVKYWEVWNEPDHKDYWQPQDHMKAYTALLQETYAAIKAEDPTARVLLGGLTNSAPFALRQVYKNGGRGSFDIMNIHPFVNPIHGKTVNAKAIKGVYGVYASVLKVMKEFGDGGKPIWITEVGCPGIIATDAPSGWWAGATPLEDQQAAWVTVVYQQALTWPGVQKVFWAFFRDTAHFWNDVDRFGLLRRDFTPKPAYAAYQAIAKHPAK